MSHTHDDVDYCQCDAGAPYPLPEELECLEFQPQTQYTCKGSVEYRDALSSSGKGFPRCDFHWEKRLKEQERINDLYPDSPIAPSGFDPTYAGERWDSDY